MVGDLVEFACVLYGKSNNSKSLVSQGKRLKLLFICLYAGDDVADIRFWTFVHLNKIFALADDIDIKGLVVHYINRPFSVIFPFSHASDTIKPDGAFALFFFQGLNI